jgi:2-keto-4-pentenoate hydratase/2-oxohepta-3-ene-1,7-dioic acid hydratase in catechol pathway
LDYEGELAFVVGRRCRNVAVEQASEVIGAWLTCNDISARDWQRETPTVTLGKSHDGFGPTGPWLVTCDEIADPHDLTIRTTVNGEQRQLGSTRDMTYNAYEQIAALTSRCTLEPGDLVTTGSPPGSAQGSSTPDWLKVGDVVRVEIEGVGSLENSVVADAGTTLIAPLTLVSDAMTTTT